MKIGVKGPDNKTSVVNLPFGASAEDLKEIIADKYPFPFILTHCSKPVRTLSQLPKQPILRVSPLVMGGTEIQVSLKMPNGKMHVIKIDNGSTLADLKNEIENITSIIPENQWLVHGGKNLKDNTKSLLALRISNFGTIQCVTRLAGGSP